MEKRPRENSKIEWIGLALKLGVPGFLVHQFSMSLPVWLGANFGVLLNKPLLCGKREECGSSPHCLRLRTILRLGIIAALRGQHCLLGERLAKGNEATLPKPLSRWKEQAARKGTNRGFRTRAEETAGCAG